DTDGFLRGAELLRDRGVPAVGLVPRQKRLESIELAYFSGLAPARAHSRHRGIERRERPVPLEQRLGRRACLGFAHKPPFGGVSVVLERDRRLTTASFFTSPAREIVQQVVAKRREQVRAKAAAIRTNVLQVTPFEDRSEESLRQIVCGFDVVALT